MSRSLEWGAQRGSRCHPAPQPGSSPLDWSQRAAGMEGRNPIYMHMRAHGQHRYAGQEREHTYKQMPQQQADICKRYQLNCAKQGSAAISEGTHTHVLKHITPTFKHMTPTRIKSHTQQLWAQHSTDSAGCWVHSACMLSAYSKANSPALRLKESGQPPALRMRRRGREGRRGEKGRRGGSSGRMTSPSLKCHHYLKPRLSCLQRWHHPIFAPPPPVLVCGEGGCLFVCVCTQACLRECSEALWRGAWVDVCLHSPRSTSYSSDASVLLASISVNAITINIFSALNAKQTNKGYHRYWQSVFSKQEELERRWVLVVSTQRNKIQCKTW